MPTHESTRLPFIERPDLSPFLVHLTRNTKAHDGYSAYQNLENILQCGEIWGSDKQKGFVKGSHKATCFMDVPLSSLKYVLNKANNTEPGCPRYEPYGIIVTKRTAYSKGVRPVLYLSNAELKKLAISRDEICRIVRFEGVTQKTIGWLHEREWRSRGDFVLPQKLVAVLVKTADEAMNLSTEILKRPKEFKTKPRSVIPLNVLCQGLPYMV